MKRLTETTTEAIEGEFIAADEWDAKKHENTFRDVSESEQRLAEMAKRQRAEYALRQQTAVNNGALGSLGGGIGGMTPGGDWLDQAGDSFGRAFGNLFGW